MRAARFDAIESSQYPRRVKICEGMCSACGADGAIFAYSRAAVSPRGASSELSFAWMR